jgi:hypothetical protein
MPTVVGVGAALASATTALVPYPGGYTAVADDCAFTFIECEGADVPVAPTNWAIAAQAVVSTGTTTKFTCFWRRLTAAEAAPTYADAGDHIHGRMIVIRGLATTGNPWDFALNTTELVADTSVSIAGSTTTGADRLVLAGFSTGQDVASTAGATGWANASLANVTERMDNWTTTGLGGGFAVASGEKAAAGASGTVTATLSLTANFKGLLYIALRSAPAGAEPPWQAQRSPRPSEMANVAGPYAPATQSQILIGG